MTERAKELAAQLFEEMTGAKKTAPKNGEAPTGITRTNLNEFKKALPSIIAICTFENEFMTPDVIRVGDLVYQELQYAEASMGKPGEPMSWQDVRDVYRRWFQMAIDALSPEGIAKRINGMNAEDRANIATPAANAAKLEDAGILQKTTPSLN